MKPRIECTIGLLTCLILCSCYSQPSRITEQIASAYATLPEGNNGIAAQYPGDRGIGDDPQVMMADDFENYAHPAELRKNWDNVSHPEYTAFTSTPANVYGGKQALEFYIPKQIRELSLGADKFLSEKQDVLFLRYYSMFHSPFEVIGSSHNGSSISANYFSEGRATPGVPADGTNKFLVNLENWRGDTSTVSPGLVNVYVYHPEQRSQWGDHFFPTGIVLPFSSVIYDFGESFVSRPEIITPMDQWFCYEYMVQANTPGQRDGRIAVWIEGKLVADFMNLRLRDVESLQIDRFGLSFHIGTNPNADARKWYDNVVAASSYIGPMKKEH